MNLSPQPLDRTRPTLSALVVAHNEEKNLEACLSALSFADEIVVVLDKTTDGSEAICRRYTDKIINGIWPIQGDRRNLGLSHCSGQWVLEVDADERVSPELAREIRAVIEGSRFDYHQIPVDNYVGGKLVRHGWGASFGRSAYSGLFRKGVKIWGQQRVHPKVKMNGTMGPRLSAQLVHYVDEDVSDMLKRLDRYSTSRALDLIDSGDIGSYHRNVARLFGRFYKCYVRRKGYKEGPIGLVIALCAALFPLLSYVKAREMLDKKTLSGKSN